MRRSRRTVGAMESPPLPLWRLTRARYDQIVDAGILGPEDHVELLDGLLVAREPQGERHTIVLALVRTALERAFGRRYWIREEKPVALDDLSAPEPDLVVVRGQPRDYLDRGHPSHPLLTVEVAMTSLALDRIRKGALYARAGLEDYWVVNLKAEVLEVYRQPVRIGDDQWKYDSVRLLKRGTIVTALAAPRARIRVASLLP